MDFTGVITTFLFLMAIYTLASSSGLLSEKSGTINISIEGNMIMGALMFVIFSSSLVPGISNIGPAAPFVIAIIAGLVGMMFSTLLSLACVTFISDNVVAGTAINMIAPALSLIVMFALFGAAQGNIPSDQLYSMGWAGAIDTTAIIFIIIAIVSLGLIWFVLKYTRTGLRLKSAGENPYTLATSGVSVSLIRYAANYVGGFLSGFAGAIAVFVLYGGLFVGGVNGMGFISLAILILARWNTVGLFIGSLVISIVMSFARNWGQLGDLSLSFPKEVMQMIPFILPLVSLMILKFIPLNPYKGTAPSAEGLPFKKDLR